MCVLYIYIYNLMGINCVDKLGAVEVAALSKYINIYIIYNFESRLIV